MLLYSVTGHKRLTQLLWAITLALVLPRGDPDCTRTCAVDAAKRTWGDKAEWKSTLLSLAEKGELEYDEDNDKVTFALPAAPQP